MLYISRCAPIRIERQRAATRTFPSDQDTSRLRVSNEPGFDDTSTVSSPGGPQYGPSRSLDNCLSLWDEAGLIARSGRAYSEVIASVERSFASEIAVHLASYQEAQTDKEFIAYIKSEREAATLEELTPEQPEASVPQPTPEPPLLERSADAPMGTPPAYEWGLTIAQLLGVDNEGGGHQEPGIAELSFTWDGRGVGMFVTSPKDRPEWWGQAKNSYTSECGQHLLSLTPRDSKALAPQLIDALKRHSGIGRLLRLPDMTAPSPQ